MNEDFRYMNFIYLNIYLKTNLLFVVNKPLTEMQRPRIYEKSMEMERVTLILTSMFMAIKFITKDSKVCAS